MGLFSKKNILLPIIFIFVFSFFSFNFMAQTSKSCKVVEYDTNNCPLFGYTHDGYCIDGPSTICAFYSTLFQECAWMVIVQDSVAGCGYIADNAYGDTNVRTDQSTRAPPSSACEGTGCNGKTCRLTWGALCDCNGEPCYVGRWDASQKSCDLCNGAFKTKQDYCMGVYTSPINTLESACGADPRCDEKHPNDNCGFIDGIRATCQTDGSCKKIDVCLSNADCDNSYVCDLNDDAKCIRCSASAVETYASNLLPDNLCDNAGITNNINGGTANCGASLQCDEHPPGYTYCVDANTVGTCGSTCQLSTTNCPAGCSAGRCNAVPDFSISATPASQSVPQGSTASYTVTANSINDFAGSVALSAIPCPPYAVCTFVPSAVSVPSGGSASSAFSVITNSSVTPNTYSIAVDGTSGSIEHSASVTLNVLDIISPIVGTILPTFTTVGTSTSFNVPVSDDKAVTSCNFIWNGFYQGPMTVPANSNNAIVTASFSYTPNNYGIYPAHATCLDAAGNIGYGSDVYVTVSPCNNNAICEEGETQGSCPDCTTTATIDPSTVTGGQSVTLTITFTDGRYLAGHAASFLLDIDGIQWNSANGCALGDNNPINPSSLPPYVSSFTSINYKGVVVASCTIPSGIAQGNHVLNVAPTIYSYPTKLLQTSTTFSVVPSNPSLIDIVNRIVSFIKNIFFR